MRTNWISISLTRVEKMPDECLSRSAHSPVAEGSSHTGLILERHLEAAATGGLGHGGHEGRSHTEAREESHGLHCFIWSWERRRWVSAVNDRAKTDQTINRDQIIRLQR